MGPFPCFLVLFQCKRACLCIAAHRPERWRRLSCSHPLWSAHTLSLHMSIWPLGACSFSLVTDLMVPLVTEGLRQACIFHPCPPAFCPVKASSIPLHRSCSACTSPLSAEPGSSVLSCKPHPSSWPSPPPSQTGHLHRPGATPKALSRQGVGNCTPHAPQRHARAVPALQCAAPISQSNPVPTAWRAHGKHFVLLLFPSLSLSLL